ncbi:MAG: hypothetical protein M3362_10765 [Acidobacteriota bacterium]|nr:hypothetical protein [Acidobacteriota bacterium]
MSPFKKRKQPNAPIQRRAREVDDNRGRALRVRCNRLLDSVTFRPPPPATPPPRRSARRPAPDGELTAPTGTTWRRREGLIRRLTTGATHSRFTTEQGYNRGAGI